MYLLDMQKSYLVKRFYLEFFQLKKIHDHEETFLYLFRYLFKLSTFHLGPTRLQKLDLSKGVYFSIISSIIFSKSDKNAFLADLLKNVSLPKLLEKKIQFEARIQSSFSKQLPSFIKFMVAFSSGRPWW